MPTIKLTTNIPVHASLKYADIVPGNFGPQVRLKGTFDKEDGMVFLPGKVWANLKALKAAGVIAAGDYNEEPTEPVELPLLHRDVVLTRSQPAGAKYADLVVTTNGATPPQATQSKPFESGPHVPGLDEEPPHPAASYTPTQSTTTADPFIHLRGAVATWNTARREILRACPDFAEDLQALNAAIATVMIEARK